MEDFVEFRIKKNKKHNVNIVYITYMQTKLSTNSELFQLFLKKYKNILVESAKTSEGGKSFLIINTTNVKSVDMSYVWSVMNEISELDSITLKYIKGSVYIINNSFIKLSVKAVMKIFKPVIPTKICQDSRETLEFMENTLK